MKFLFSTILILTANLVLIAQQFEIPNIDGKNWYKGNLHTHAREGESDSSVEEVVNWYEQHGYDFLVITDHSVITIPDMSQVSSDSFLFIPGEEIIGKSENHELEINGFNMSTAILLVKTDNPQTTLQTCIDSVRQQNAIPMINHPYYQWALNEEMIFQSKNCNLFELYNGFPGLNHQGDATHPSLEKVWDNLLTKGKRMYGVASDDGHVYKNFSPDESNPGRGWVVVLASSLDKNEIMRNLDAGLFYSSTGVVVQNIQIEPQKLVISFDQKLETKYKTEFIGTKGRLLSTTDVNPAVYNLNDETSYVRAKITDSNGRCAWIQPVFTK